MSHMTNYLNRQIGAPARGRRFMPALLALCFACTGGDSLTNPPSNDGRGSVPWDLGLSYGAINMAIGDEVQLSVNPVNADGEPMSGLPAVEYTVSDTSAKIDASGKLTATSARANIVLVAKMQSVEGNWTIADTARVTVVPTRYTVAGFRMLPNGPEWQPANQTRRFDAFVVDAAGNAVLGTNGDTIRPVTRYHVSTPRKEYYVSTNWTAQGIARNLSEPRIVGESYIFGTVYRDSVKFRVTYPDSASLSIHRVNFNATPSPSAMSQTDLTILQGGKVTFRTLNTTRQDDIVFDDLANVVNGSIPVVPGNPGHAVTFPNLGSFTYKSSSGFGGTITVVARP